MTLMNNAIHGDMISTKIWQEETTAESPFVAQRSLCAGYDVYNQVLGNASWAEFLYLLFKQARPTAKQATMLNDLAVGLANAGPRDFAVRSAINASIAGGTAASALMAALATGAGSLNGGHAVVLMSQLIKQCGSDLAAWQLAFSTAQFYQNKDWPAAPQPPGFDAMSTSTSEPVLKMLTHFSALDETAYCAWWRENIATLESYAGWPLGMHGVAAIVLSALDFTARQAEYLWLLMRLPGAAAHAEEQYMQWGQTQVFTDCIEFKRPLINA
ncbi:MAG: citryl-CoA lyase [Gammaproteobacteria bacterium]|nr:citryl-CoA lyase [Gammaproteobacteria bacterium]